MSAEKVVVKREINIDIDVPATYVFKPIDLDLDEGMSLEEWYSAQDDSAYQIAKDLGLFDEVILHVQLVEYYEDGTRKLVDRATWRTDD
jgi:hypothetical protein